MIEDDYFMNQLNNISCYITCLVHYLALGHDIIAGNDLRGDVPPCFLYNYALLIHYTHWNSVGMIVDDYFMYQFNNISCYIT